MTGLPSSWYRGPLSTVSASIQYGFTASSSASHTGPRYLRITDIQRGVVDWSHVPRVKVSGQETLQYLLAKGDIVFARSGATVGKSFLIVDDPGDAIFASYLIRVRCDGRVVMPEYAYYFFRSPDYWDAIIQGATGTGQPNFNGTKLGNLHVPVAPLAEQRRIVAKLDSLTARTAKARTELDRIPNLIAKYKQAILEREFSTEGWRREPFFDLLDFKGGSQPPKSEFSVSPKPGFVRLLQIRDFASDARAVYIKDGPRWPKCDTEDIMVGRYGASVGKVMSGKAGAYNVALVKMIVDQARLMKQFVYYWLQASEFQDALANVSRSAQNGFNKADLERMEVPVPSLDVQAGSVRRIGAAFATMDFLLAEHARATHLLPKLDQAILAKAFRGELVPQDPNDEPASVLLERIKAERAGAAQPVRKRKARALR